MYSNGRTAIQFIIQSGKFLKGKSTLIYMLRWKAVIDTMSGTHFIGYSKFFFILLHQLFIPYLSFIILFLPLKKTFSSLFLLIYCQNEWYLKTYIICMPPILCLGVEPKMEKSLKAFIISTWKMLFTAEPVIVIAFFWGFAFYLRCFHCLSF